VADRRVLRVTLRYASINSLFVERPEISPFSEDFHEYSTVFGADVPEDFAREMMEFDDQVGAEDDALTDSVQRGLRAGIPVQGRFLPESEQLVIRFQRMVLSALS
jgi:hypothetical protein